MNIENKINEIVDRVLNEALNVKEGEWKEEMGKAPEYRSEGGNSEVVGVYSNIKNQRREQEETMCEQCGMTEELCECGMSEGEMEEGAKPDFLDLDNDGDKKEPMKNAAKDAKKDSKNKSKKKTISLSESEMIELIQRLVIEEKEAVGTKETNRILKGSKKVNDEAMKDVTKKMTEYLKDGSNEKYEANPESFPKGNGEMGEDDKMMYHASDAVEEYIDQIARSGGMENLEYDAIKPDEEWIEMNIMGDSKTGNSQEYANAVQTKTGEKVNQRRLKDWLGKLKKNSYQKAVQPVEDIAGRKKGDKAAMSPDDVMAALSEKVEDKKTIKINEDIEKMKSMLSYSRKTQ